LFLQVSRLVEGGVTPGTVLIACVTSYTVMQYRGIFFSILRRFKQVLYLVDWPTSIKDFCSDR